MSKQDTKKMKTVVCPHLFCNSFICDYEPDCYLLPCAKHYKTMVDDTKLRQQIRYLWNKLRGKLI